ncbi:apolipo protein O-domain-containing protein [Halteromyces radiatus]|uniref:apolipo protein O-domain-containing protein n=1 Tax=Halteromyces radiatus TaxID=101107 RepID=UPI002220FB0D|nr:apolipo protein O-domain-containing protein [Halteromyces radiatus]KAI8098588.1 apolipo protein O-domain-containing protein [Halteromyces radiatus]
MFSPVLKRSLVTAAAGAVALQSVSTVHAEENTTTTRKSKLSIYDEPEPKRIVIESPTKLEEHVAYAQKYANDALDEGKAHVDTFHNHVQSIENDIRGTINEIIAKDEDILPNAMYIGVAALAGTIIARNRNIVLRFLTSTALATGASFYLLPKTTHNLGVQLEKLERKYPELGKVHTSINEAIGDVRKQVDDTLLSLRGQLDQGKELVKQQVNETDSFAATKKKVESMYSTRSSPAVEETLKKD